MVDMTKGIANEKLNACYTAAVATRKDGPLHDQKRQKNTLMSRKPRENKARMTTTEDGVPKLLK